MLKRAVCIFICFCLLFAGIGTRVGLITTGVSSPAGISSGGYRLDIGEVRGTVFDCNMLPLVNSEFDCYAAAKPTNDAIAAMKKAAEPQAFQNVYERMQSGKPTAARTRHAVKGCADVITVRCAKRYSAFPLAVHIIGYTGSDGKGVCGIEKAYDSLLGDYSLDVYVRLSADARGRMLMGEDICVNGSGEIPQGGVVLTIDSIIQRIAENAMDSMGIDSGAVVILDIGSGAVRACASRPTYSPSSPADSLNSLNSPFINRALRAFSVGSVFKPVVAAAALENGIGADYTCDCLGKTTLNGVTFNCHKDEGHGIADMCRATAESCNVYFINLALKTGSDAIIETAAKLGFGKSTVLAPGIISVAGNLPDKAELDSDAARANLAFGQGSLLATPLQLAAMMACIANSGVACTPYLIEGTRSADGSFTKAAVPSRQVRAISRQTARALGVFLNEVVTSGSGKRAACEYFESAGKTATAQTGKSENGVEIYNTWFAGYFPADNPQYAVAILKENGSEGAVSCAPVFGAISKMMFEADCLTK